MWKSRFVAFSKGPVAFLADWGGAFGVVYAIINLFTTWAAGKVEPVSNLGLWAVILTGAVTASVLVVSVAIGLSAKLSKSSPLPRGEGGKGGGVDDIDGENIRVHGGRGGSGGPPGGGVGGAGGGAKSLRGTNIVVIGGDGGSAGGWDGRGGRPGGSTAEVAGAPTELWHVGRDGAGTNEPEYNRRLAILIEIRQRWAAQFPDQVIFVLAGVDQVPISYVNARLGEIGETWRIELQEGGYKMPNLDPSPQKISN